MKLNLQKNKTSYLFWIGLLLFFGMNLFSAATMGIHFDEAYYWLYSKYPAFGYFDHPPMVAWMIYAGQLIFKNILGLRIVTVIFSTISAYILWLISKPYANKPLLFWALMYSIILIHPYTFITTPDAPLLFFTVVFFFSYQKYTNSPNTKNLLLFALVSALLIYSKYHAILLIGFTILSNLKWMLKKDFWINALLIVVCLSPHIYWQISNDFVSFKYHLIDSHKNTYRIGVTLNYLLSQLLLTGPWMGWLFLYVLTVIKVETQSEKALKYVGMGTFIFFFFATFSGDIESHWTLIAFIPLLILSFKYLSTTERWRKLIYISGGINFILLLTFKIILITPLASHIYAMRLFTGWQNDSEILKTAIGDYPVLFQDSWNRASRYAWYVNDPKVSGLNSGMYRKNQFDLWNHDEEFTGQSVCMVSRDSAQFTDAIKVKTPKSTWYYKIIPNFKSYYDLTFKTLNNIPQKECKSIDVSISNPYTNDVLLDQQLNNSRFIVYQRMDSQWKQLIEIPIAGLTIPANSQRDFHIEFPKPINLSEMKGIYLMLQIGEIRPIPTRILVSDD